MDKAEFPPGLRGFLEGEVALHRTVRYDASRTFLRTWLKH